MILSLVAILIKGAEAKSISRSVVMSKVNELLGTPDCMPGGEIPCGATREWVSAHFGREVKLSRWTRPVGESRLRRCIQRRECRRHPLR